MAAHSSGQSCCGSAQESVCYVGVKGAESGILGIRAQHGGPLRREREENQGEKTDSLLGENTLVSTEMAHQVRRDSAEVKGQDVVVVVGVGSLTGKTLIPSRAGRVLAAGVRVGLYSLLPVTVSIKGILPLWARERNIRSLDAWHLLS